MQKRSNDMDSAWHLDKRLPGHTGAIGQTQTIQQNQLAKMVVGFRDINAIGGGA